MPYLDQKIMNFLQDDKPVYFILDFDRIYI